MEKMGYKAGEGLGRNKQGISTAIEAKMRPKGAGLGARGEEHKLIPDKEPETEGPAKKVPF